MIHLLTNQQFYFNSLVFYILRHTTTSSFFFFNDPPPPEISPLPLPDALPISAGGCSTASFTRHSDQAGTIARKAAAPSSSICSRFGPTSSPASWARSLPSPAATPRQIGRAHV